MIKSKLRIQTSVVSGRDLLEMFYVPKSPHPWAETLVDDLR